MAPYLGLLTKRGELTGGKYCRRDLSDVRFVVSPSEKPNTLIVLNQDMIRFDYLEPSTSPVVGVAVFAEIDGDEIVASTPIPPQTLGPSDSIYLRPGALSFDHRFTNCFNESNITRSEHEDIVDRLRLALKKIAEAPASVTSRELRLIARKALAEL